MVVVQGGEEEEQRGSFASYYPWLLARYKTLCRAKDPSDSRTVTLRETQRRGHSGSAYHYNLSWKTNRATESCLSLFRRLIGIIVFPSGISSTLSQGILLLRITLHFRTFPASFFFLRGNKEAEDRRTTRGKKVPLYLSCCA